MRNVYVKLCLNCPQIGAALLVLAVFGWVIYLVGFGMRNTE